MSADLHLHIVTDEEVEKHVKIYLTKSFWSTQGGNGYQELKINGKWIHENDWDGKSKVKARRNVFVEFNEELIYNTPNIWIGEVSWLKAALFNDADTFIPVPVQKIAGLVKDHLPVIDTALIEQIEDAFNIKNNTVKKDGVWSSSGYRLAEPKDVVEFLKSYIGKKVFQISW